MKLKLPFTKKSGHSSVWAKDGDISVFFACDDGYIPYLIVCLRSLIDHASPKNNYDIHVLFTNISEENKYQVMRLGTQNVHISFHDVTDRVSRLKSKLSVRDYYSATTYYRFFIPEMFPDLDKALYIDADTILLADIAELYRYNLGNNLIGAVQDQLVLNTDVYGKYVENVLDISQAAYFNAGVVLLNSELLRKEKLIEKFVELLNSYVFVVAQDQDYLNILCQDRILWVNSKWNVQVTEKQLRQKEAIGLIHYNLAEKPWHYENGRYSEYFWEYAKKTAMYDQIRKNLAEFSETDREKDAAAGRNLLNLAEGEIANEKNYHRSVTPMHQRQLTRQEIVQRIEQYEREGRFDEDVENDPPSRMLMPDEIDYLRKNYASRIRARYAYKIAKWFLKDMLEKKQIIIKDIVGIENYAGLDSGAIITSNHFNAMDSFANEIAYMKSGQKRRKLFRVIREGNYTSFPGFYGFLMRNCNTLPLSSNPKTMKKFLKAVNEILKRGHFILIYPEQSMWWNYRKPKPLKKGGYRFAVNAGVPVLPTFITMSDSDIPGEGGFPVQEYTIHIGKPIYPVPGRTPAENVQYMMEKNSEWWKEVYEKTYGLPLTYTTENVPISNE